MFYYSKTSLQERMNAGKFIYVQLEAPIAKRIPLLRKCAIIRYYCFTP